MDEVGGNANVQSLPPPKPQSIWIPLPSKYTGGWKPEKVVRYDDSLCSDGEALYKYILTHAASSPQFLIECKGTHDEIVKTSRDDSEKRTFVDFEFTIDASDSVLEGSAWVVGDGTTACRGSFWERVAEISQSTDLEKVSSGNRRTLVATPEEESKSKTRQRRRYEEGLPPWTPLPNEPYTTQARLEMTCTTASQKGKAPPFESPLREAVNSFCTSRLPLKEFTIRTSLYGWKLPALEKHLIRILSQNQPERCRTVHVSFIMAEGEIVVRPDNVLWWILGKKIVFFVLCVTLIYPLIFMPLRYAFLGGRWCMAGVSFALMKEASRHPDSDSSVGSGKSWVEEQETSTGPVREGVPLVGVSEEAWLTQWTTTTVELASSGRIIKAVLKSTSDVPSIEEDRG